MIEVDARGRENRSCGNRMNDLGELRCVECHNGHRIRDAKAPSSLSRKKTKQGQAEACPCV